MGDVSDLVRDHPPLEDLAIIGNSRTAAVLDRDGGVVWFCAPRFDSPSVFCSLLDRRKGGDFRVRPEGGYRVTRRYVGPAPVLETTFHVEPGDGGEPRGGVLVVTDLMPVVTEEERHRRAWPEHLILRKVECREGAVRTRTTFAPRPDYGRTVPRMRQKGRLGLWCEQGGEILTVHGDMGLELDEEAVTASSTLLLEEGECRWVALTYVHREPAVLMDPVEEGEELLAKTLGWWEEWAGSNRYDGPYRDVVIRSAVTLKLLTYAPSGAVVAAATTSLPEVVGGSRNWDYRFCWLRDASWTLRALFDLGYRDEARAFSDWILYATRLSAPDLQTLYDVHGRTRLEEKDLDHLEGYRCSRPVRIGNGAHDQLQLDTYGEVVVAMFEYVDRGGKLDRGDRTFMLGVGHRLCERWREKDRGIWEVRGEAHHFTYSKVMTWAALDRILELRERGELPDADEKVLERFRRDREEIRDQVESRAYDTDRDCYLGAFDHDFADGALLRLPAVGYVQADDPRMVNTRKHLQEVLGNGEGLMYRYPPGTDDLPGREGAFDLVSFWLVECLALAGDTEEARRCFEHLLDQGNDLGLFTEQTDPETGARLGNFPQAFTHIGLINAALTLERCAREEASATPAQRHDGDAPVAAAGERGGASRHDDVKEPR